MQDFSSGDWSHVLAPFKGDGKSEHSLAFQGEKVKFSSLRLPFKIELGEQLILCNYDFIGLHRNAHIGAAFSFLQFRGRNFPSLLISLLSFLLKLPLVTK